MKKFIALFLVCIVLASTAQEELQPLRYNAKLTSKKSQEKASELHESFIYSIDTLVLPIVDDFSRDHFKKYDADTADANVSDTTWFALEILGVPEPWGTTYMLDTTYRYEFDTVPGFGFDSIKIDTIALASKMVDVFDLSAYPIVMLNQEVWPTTYTYDSLWTSTSPDVTIYESEPDLTQDSATIYFVASTLADTAIYWVDNHAYRNNNFPIDPESIGVATLDGLDEYGYPYDWSSSSAYGIADYLTSKPIAMGGYTALDDIFFSFLFQAGGLGEEPEYQDSLVLEFWSPVTAQWNSVWNTPGQVSTAFQVVMIPIVESDYLSDGFRFRFKNYGSLTGSLDHWHIDYVYLDDFRSASNTTMNDQAFRYDAPSLINTYTSMPWSHYQLVPHSMMKTTTDVEIYNSNPTAVNLNATTIDETFMKLQYQGTTIDSIKYISSGNIPGMDKLVMNYSIPSTFWCDTAVADTLAVFDAHYVFQTTTPTNSLAELRRNDTLWQTQVFDNYYSYDDGTAEAAYGLVANGAELAYQFTLPAGLTDTLRSIKMYFAASVNDASLDPFFLQVWNDVGGEPGDLIYTTDDQDLPITFTPIYSVGVDAFWEYVLPQQVLVSGTFYVGWKQTTSNRLNIGFDKNINNQSKIFYDLGSGWNNTGFAGSLMIRPIFTSKKDALFVSMEEQPKEELSFVMYPNPANNQLNVSVNDRFEGEMKIFDMQGRLLLNEYFNGATVVNIEDLPSGLFIVQVVDSNGHASSNMLSVSR